MAPNLLERTNGQLQLVVSTVSDLGLNPQDTLALLRDGKVAMAPVYSVFADHELPTMSIEILFGLYPNDETAFRASEALAPTLEEMVQKATGGVVVNHSWFPADTYILSKIPIRTPEDFNGLKIQALILRDWLEAMGAEMESLDPPLVYSALKDGPLDAAVTLGDVSFDQKWYEVTEYMVGPLYNFVNANNVVNGELWSTLPVDLQRIMNEEGAKAELEGLRLLGAQREALVDKYIQTDTLKLVEFSLELHAESFQGAVSKCLIPSWVGRVGGVDSEAVKVFNDKIGPLLSVYIASDGTLEPLP